MSGCPDAGRKGENPAPPYSLRFTVEERAQLDRDAGNRPLASYIREQLFGVATTKRRRQRARRVHRPLADQMALAQALARLGRSQLASNLNEIAEAARIGALPVTQELLQELCVACGDIHRMRQELVAALGLREDPS